MTTVQKMQGELFVTQDEFQRLQVCCVEGYIGHSDKGYEYDAEYVFPNGLRMAIQVCRSRGESCWTQGVLFDGNGCELGCDSVGDSLSGAFEIEYDECIYSVEVKAR